VAQLILERIATPYTLPAASTAVTNPPILPACLLACLPAVKRGDRVAQLILERIATPDVVEVESLDETQRGAGGYGSTGVSS